jgi:DNA-binding NtrC family response regulator
MSAEPFGSEVSVKPQTVQEIGAALAACNLDGVPLGMLEQAAMLAALEKYHGNRTLAARSLHISVRTLQRKLRLWGADQTAEADEEDLPLTY